MLVKLGSLGAARLVGTVAANEILNDASSEFLVLDPPHGVGLRNFHIQVAKTATQADIVVYSKRGIPTEGLLALARRIATAQISHRKRVPTAPVCRTYVVADPFAVFEQSFPGLVAVSASGRIYESARDFLALERAEMNRMSAASEIAPNIYLGNAHDAQLECDDDLDDDDDGGDEDEGMSDSVPPGRWDIYIECVAAALLPSEKQLRAIDKEHLDFAPSSLSSSSSSSSSAAVAHVEFPASGSLALGNLTDRDIEAIVDFCEWLHRHASSRRILLYCVDGYTETSLLALAYLIYSTGRTAPEAYIALHMPPCSRAFFTFPADLILLNHLQTRLLLRSPVENAVALLGRVPDLPQWFISLDGSLPSKIFPHMYLGNLSHANNHGLLRELGIKRVLSVGEMIDWCVASDSAPEPEPDSGSRPSLRRKSAPGAMEDSFGEAPCADSVAEATESLDDSAIISGDQVPVTGFTKVMYVDQIQDDGIDSLSKSIDACLAFLDEGFRAGEPTLVHCRVGVSRSATICIAEVMRRQKLSLPRAYLYVRAHRLNVIIQPNLRFMYELMKWEEEEAKRQGIVHRREMEWSILCREIAAMNKAYIG